MNPDDSIFVAGHRGLVGSAIVRRLRSVGYDNLILRSRKELDLKCQSAVEEFFAAARPSYVFLAAARVGGILANDTYTAEFLYENLAIQLNVIDTAYRHGTRKLLFLGSSCIYPRNAPQPMREECLLTGALEPTNEWYAIAKIAGVKMCQAYRRQYGFDAISVMPTNLYGPGDNFNLRNSHVVPALLRKFHEAKEAGMAEVQVWGTGNPRREFLYVDDLADACFFLMKKYADERPINVGWGVDSTIAELVETIRRVVGFSGAIRFDASQPDGAPRKLLATDRITALGWLPRIELEAGLRATYEWFLEHRATLRC